jgi:hypothetical protein
MNFADKHGDKSSQSPRPYQDSTEPLSQQATRDRQKKIVEANRVTRMSVQVKYICIYTEHVTIPLVADFEQFSTIVLTTPLCNHLCTQVTSKGWSRLE